MTRRLCCIILPEGVASDTGWLLTPRLPRPPTSPHARSQAIHADTHAHFTRALAIPTRNHVLSLPPSIPHPSILNCLCEFFLLQFHRASKVPASPPCPYLLFPSIVPPPLPSPCSHSPQPLSLLLLLRTAHVINIYCLLSKISTHTHILCSRKSHHLSLAIMVTPRLFLAVVTSQKLAG